MTTTTSELVHLPVDQLYPSPDNLRDDLDDLDSLADSIRSLGVLEPLLVRPHDDGRFEILAGERRHAAAQRAGLDEVPCLVRDTADADAEADAVLIMLVENGQRVGFTPLQEATGYAHLVRLGRSQHDIAAAVGKSQAHVSKRLALLRLPDVALAAVKAGARDGGITLEQAVDLASLVDTPDRLDRVVSVIGSAGFDGRLRVEVAELRRDQAIAREVGRLREAGHDVFTQYRADQLVGEDYGVEVDVEAHAAEPCHAAGVTANADTVWLCIDRARHAHDGDSDLKARNMPAPAAPPSSGPAPAPAPPAASQASPSSSAGVPVPEGEQGEHTPADADPLAGLDSASVEEQRLLDDVPVSDAELERLADVERVKAFAGTFDDRRQKIAAWFSRAKPSKADAVGLIAAQFAHETYVEDRDSLFRQFLGVGPDVTWPEYVAKNDQQATKFVTALALVLIEAAFDATTERTYQGVPPGWFADDPQVARHYDFVADFGYRPQPAEVDLLTAPPETEAPDGTAPTNGSPTADVVPAADAVGDPHPGPAWLTCQECETFGAIAVTVTGAGPDGEDEHRWHRCPEGHEPRRHGDPDAYPPEDPSYGTGYWYTDHPDIDGQLEAHVAPYIPADTCIAPGCDQSAKGTRGYCPTHHADADFHPEVRDALALATGQPDKLRAPLEEYHPPERLAAYTEATPA